MTYVDVDENAGLLYINKRNSVLYETKTVSEETYVAGVDARDGDERAGRAAAAVGDVDLAAGDLQTKAEHGQRAVPSTHTRARVREG